MYTAMTLSMAAVNESLGISPFGLHQMAGNVWQWCRDWYDAGFYQRPEASAPNAFHSAETGVRSERGGSWVGPAELCRSSHRWGRPPLARGRCLGFRCVRDVRRQTIRLSCSFGRSGRGSAHERRGLPVCSKAGLEMHNNNTWNRCRPVLVLGRMPAAPPLLVDPAHWNRNSAVKQFIVAHRTRTVP